MTHTGKLVYLEFDFQCADERHRVELESRVYEVMARYSLNLYMMNLSPTGIGFAVPRDQYPTVEDLLDGLVIPLGDEDRAIYLFQIGAKPSREAETQLQLLASLGPIRTVRLDLTEGCTMVSLIGNEVLQQPGVFHRVLTTMHEAQIPVLQTSDSELSLSCLIPESELERAVRLLHESFDLMAAS